MLKRITINRVDSLSAGKVLGGLYTVIGLFGGMFMGATMMIENAVIRGNGQASFGVILGAMMLVVAPIGCGLLGFISGVLMSLFYNLAAGYMGGFVLEVVDDSEDDED